MCPCHPARSSSSALGKGLPSQVGGMALSIHGSILSLFISWSPRASPLLQACSRDKDPQIGISNLRTLTWGCDSTGHGGDTEEVSTESQNRDGEGPRCSPAHQAHPCSWSRLPSWTLPDYLAAYRPHGVMGIGTVTNLCTEGTGFSSIFPGIHPHLMTLNMFFQVPFIRDYIMLGGKSSDRWIA